MLGAIARPGRYRFDSSMTLLDLLAEAGGPTSSAYIKKIVVINMATSGQGDQARSFDLDGFAKEPDLASCRCCVQGTPSLSLIAKAATGPSSWMACATF